MSNYKNPELEEDELVDEANTTAGAGGQYSTKYAFGNKKKKAPKGFKYVEPSLYETYSYDELLKNISNLINEISYTQFKNNPDSSYKNKINNGIKEISTQLYQMEQSLKRVHKLKTEINADQSIFFKSTFTRFSKISERLLKLSNQIRELSK